MTTKTPLTANIDRTILIDALTRAHDHWTAEKSRRYEVMVDYWMTQRRAWWSSRTYSREEAVALISDFWRNYTAHGFDEWDVADNRTRRAERMLEAIQTRHATDIRISEQDLRFIQPFLDDATM